MEVRGAALSVCRIAAGPLAIVGFFLPWADGPGVLSAATFSGYSLVRFTGDLRQLDLDLAEGGLLWLSRLAILAVPIAGTWQVVLAPRLRWHRMYGWSGWYLVAFAATALGVGLWRVRLAVPPPGLALVAAAAACFLAGEGSDRWRFRGRSPAP